MDNKKDYFVEAKEINDRMRDAYITGNDHVTIVGVISKISIDQLRENDFDVDVVCEDGKQRTTISWGQKPPI